MKRWLLWSLLAVQGICASVFIYDIAADLFGLRTRPPDWQTNEAIEIGAALGLLLGVVSVSWLLISMNNRNRRMAEKLREASSAFAAVLGDRFADWGLTPAETDVAWLTLKGFALAEIAALRETSEGTVKAQSNAIYRKAGVSGRTQLLSLFIEDLLEKRPDAAPRAPLS